ncbi:hypothetical protein PV326_005891 [Microctonus aethiopoides]|nr:hypothetical protein PV326_005891 [Microctonus aethiopoides]
MFSQLKLLESDGGVIDKSTANLSSTVYQNVKSIEISTKINPTSPPNPNHQSKIHLIPQNIPQPTKNKRQGKIFSDLSFLTGLGIGSLATSAIIPSKTKSSSINEPNLYNISQSTNHLLNEAVKSMQEIVEQLKTRFPTKETINMEPSLPQPIPSSSLSSTSMINNRPMLTFNNEAIDDSNQIDGTSDIRVFKKADDQFTVLNCTALKEIIRETIKENNVYNEQRQATPSDDMETSSVTTDSSKDTTTMLTIPDSTTQQQRPQINATTEYPGYYGGNSQNISGISFISGSYPSTSYGYPNMIQNINGPLPIYPSEPFHHRYQYPPEYYQHEIIDEYPPDSSINSNHHFSSVPEHWPIYPPYAKARKFSAPGNNKLIGGNGFIPLNNIG